MKKLFPLLSLLLMLGMWACTPAEEKADECFRKGNQLLQRSDVKGAMTAYEEALSYYEKDYYYVSLGHCYMNFREYKKAIAEYDKAIKLNPRNGDAYYNRGLCWFYLGDKEKSCADWHKANDNGKENLGERLRTCP